MTQNRTEEEIARQIKKIRTSSGSQYHWTGSCWCGEVEWTPGFQGHFCGLFCRDGYEQEQRMKRINGKG